MGVEARIVIAGLDEARARDAAAAAFARLAELEDVLSDYRPTSEASRLGRTHDVWVPISGDLFRVLDQSKALHASTDGAFDVTVGPFVELWRAARRDGTLPPIPAVGDARSSVGMDGVRLDPASRSAMLERPDMRLDFGGIGKGFAAQEAITTLAEHGADRALVAIAGDIAAGGPPSEGTAWIVEVEPIDGSRPVLLDLVHRSTSTSGDTEQFLEVDGVRYSHIIDPLTGLGTTERRRATVVGPDGAVVDALSSALCIVPWEEIAAVVERHPGVEARVVRPVDHGDGRTTFDVWSSPGFAHDAHREHAADQAASR